jgi:uncharacterized membrane protein YhiD involved in acid resistance
MAIGFGEYMIAIISTIVAFINLTFLRKLENILPVNRYCNLHIRLKGSEGIDIRDIAEFLNIKVLALRQRYKKEDNIFEQEVSIRYKDDKQLMNFFKSLKEMPSVIEIIIS